ncbi:putative monovalent cation/H+ antiporter subunit A [Candidatus Nitrospira bockiana]
MGLTATVVSGFLLAVAAPWLHRLARGATGWLLALLPLVHLIYLAGYLPSVSSGRTFSESYTWMPSIGITLSFHLDGLGLLFALLISSIGVLVLIYSNGYMAGRRDQGRFYAFILMFMASMTGIVLADDLVVLYVFWELTSLSSYLLIGFDHESREIREAAKQALVLTSGGGLAMLAGLLLLAQAGGTLQLSMLREHGDVVRGGAFYAPILLLVLAGAATKSAQVPFHIWLPNAMGAPTPVSAYLHSATMVKAGVYLLARLSPVLGGTELWTGLLAAIGVTTMLTGAVLALPQQDMKRGLAYATISVLGMLVLLLGLGTEAAMHAAVFYLVAHAMYKGALFFVAGSLDHETGTRRLDRLGGLRRAMPVTAVVSILAALSMAGMPAFLGFVSKELLYEASLDAPAGSVFFTTAAGVASLLFVAAALLLGVRPFFGRLGRLPRQPHDPSLGMWGATALLAGAGLVCGLRPTVLEDLLGPAAAAVGPGAGDHHVAAWPGWTRTFGLSVLTLALGVAVFAARRKILQAAAWLAPAVRWGAQEAYRRGEAALLRLAARQTRLLQNGSLSWYVRVTIATVVVLAGYPLLASELSVQSRHWLHLQFHEVGIAVVIVAATGAVAIASSRLAALTALGVIGYSMALLFIFFGAPDLAMTQFLVDTLIVILLVLVLPGLPESPGLSSPATRLRDGMFAALIGMLVCVLVLLATSIPISPELAQFYAAEGPSRAHGSNLVNVILVDFRAFDTLGEITVLAMAGIGVLALLKGRPVRQKESG